MPSVNLASVVKNEFGDDIPFRDKKFTTIGDLIVFSLAFESPQSQLSGTEKVKAFALILDVQETLTKGDQFYVFTLDDASFIKRRSEVALNVIGHGNLARALEGK